MNQKRYLKFLVAGTIILASCIQVGVALASGPGSTLSGGRSRERLHHRREGPDDDSSRPSGDVRRHESESCAGVLPRPCEPLYYTEAALGISYFS